MARAYLKWSVREMADNAGVGVNTVKRVEEVDGFPENARAGSLNSIVNAILATGKVRFEGDTCVCITEDN